MHRNVTILLLRRHATTAPPTHNEGSTTLVRSALGPCGQE